MAEDQGKEKQASGQEATGKSAPVAKGVEEKPAAPGKPAAPAAPAAEPWDGELVQSLRKAFPDISLEALTYRAQNYFLLPRESILPVAMFLKAECGFNMLADLTAVDYPQREKRFEVIYQLYSFPRNERLRLKVPLGETESIESVVPVWGTADWLEREAYDMFGIRFEHHPDLRRILLPEEWQGYPLRKDYSILQQDTKWVQENLHIESGQ
ncbi:MAG: NADH-quinone oxidoreductase subunit C [Acidobacteria bacterium]|nr:NADH-quinone oxidoreductase subunit C [Acidobacteriota bacterium]